MAPHRLLLATMATLALPPALPADIFGSEGSNHIRRECIADSLADYHINPNNGNAVAPAILFKPMTWNTGYRTPSAMGIIVNGIIRTLCMPQRMDLLMGQAPDGDALVLTWSREFLQSAPFNVAITERHIALPTGILSMCSVVHIWDELNTNPDQKMFDPPVNGAPITEHQHPRKLIPIPFKPVALFLTVLVTPQYYFTNIYPKSL